MKTCSPNLVLTGLIFLLTLILNTELKAQKDWIEIQSGTTNTLHSIYFSNFNTGYIAGDNGTILKTTDNGDSWFSLNSGTNERLYDVAFLTQNSSSGFAVGDNGLILFSTNAGNSWSPVNSGTNEKLYSIFFPGNNTGYISGTNGTILEVFANGSIGSMQNYNYCHNLISMYFSNTNTGYVACSTATILKTTDGGAAWDSVGTTPGWLRTIHSLDSNKGFATGWGGDIYLTNDGGSNWNTIYTSDNALERIYFPDNNTGYAAGWGGTIFRTRDGGNSWISISYNTSNDFYSVFFNNPDNGFIVGQNGIILKTTTGGLVSIEEDLRQVHPNDSYLFPNYPNPFNPVTTINYQVIRSDNVELEIYNLAGQKVKTLVNEWKITGIYQTQWNGIDSNQRKVSSGVYLYRLRVGSYILTRKMLLVR